MKQKVLGTLRALSYLSALERLLLMQFSHITNSHNFLCSLHIFACKFGINRAFAALDEVAGHYGDDTGPGAETFPCASQMLRMSVMEGVVFRNDANNILHIYPLFLKKALPFLKNRLK